MSASLGPGSMSGGVSASAVQTPRPPSIVERLSQQENVTLSHTEALTQMDRILGNMATQIYELRKELGLIPLEADYFNIPGADSIRL